MREPLLGRLAGLRHDQGGLLPALAALVLLMLGGGIFLTVGWVFFRGLIILILAGVFLIVVAAMVLYANAKGVPLGRTAVTLLLVLAVSGIVVFFTAGLVFDISTDAGFRCGTTLTCDTQEIHAQGWVGSGLFEGKGGSQHGNVDLYREIMTDDDYVASWSSDFDGQAVPYQAKYKSDGVFGCAYMEAWQYRVYINTGSGQGWQEVDRWGGPPNALIGLGWYTGNAGTFQLTNQRHGSGIRVEFWLKCWDLQNEWQDGRDVHKQAVDEARIEGGIGEVGWQKGQYVPGENACVTVRVPYTTDGEGKGWHVTIFSTAQNRVVQNKSITQTVENVCYTVTTADFTVSEGCRNELVAILTNEVFDKDFDSATVIDVSGLGPTVTDGRFSPSNPKQGDSITVSWRAAVNSQTDLPLKKIVVKYGIGDIVEKELGPDATSFQFVAGSAGKWHVEVIVYDEGCRPSEPLKIDIKVGEEGEEDIAAWPWGLILALVVWFTAAGVVSYASLNKKKYPNFPRRIAAAGLVVGLALILLWYFRVI